MNLEWSEFQEDVARRIALGENMALSLPRRSGKGYVERRVREVRAELVQEGHTDAPGAVPEDMTSPFRPRKKRSGVAVLGGIIGVLLVLAASIALSAFVVMLLWGAIGPIFADEGSSWRTISFGQAIPVAIAIGVITGGISNR